MKGEHLYCRAREYLNRIYSAAAGSRNGRSDLTVARLGLIACSAAQAAQTHGPRFIPAPDNWEWPRVTSWGTGKCPK